MDNRNINEAGSSLGREVSSEKCLEVEKSKDFFKKPGAHKIKCPIDGITELQPSLWWIKKKKRLSLESPLDCKDIKPVNPKGNQS